MKITIKPVKGLDGEVIRVPKREAGDVVKDEDGNPVMRDGTTVDIIDLLIFNIPGQVFTRQDAIHAQRLYDQAHDAMDGIMEVKETEFKWLMKKLADDNVGPKIFRANLIPVEEALKEDKPTAEPENSEP